MSHQFAREPEIGNLLWHPRFNTERGRKLGLKSGPSGPKGVDAREPNARAEVESVGTSERADGLSGVSLKMALHLRFTNYGCMCVCVSKLGDSRNDVCLWDSRFPLNQPEKGTLKENQRETNQVQSSKSLYFHKWRLLKVDANLLISRSKSGCTALVLK